MKYISWIWSRVVNPLFMLGGFFYSWGSIYKVSHIFGYVNLLNPLLYAMEGMRAASLGQVGFLPFYVCVLAILGFIALFSMHAVCLLKKRLDCV
jgi:ABC-2 type transport system permease protein